MTRRVLAGQAAVYLAANLGSSAIPFLLLPVLTRVLSPIDYGMVAVFATAITVLGAFTGLSVHGAVNVRYHDGRFDRPRYAGTVLCLLAASTALVLLVLAFAPEHALAWSGLSRGWLLAAAGASAANFIVQVRLVLWQAAGQARAYGMLQVAQTALNLGLSVVLVLSVDLGWAGRALGIVGAMVLTGALALVLLLWRAHDAVLRPSAAYAGDALRFGLPLMPHVLGSIAIANSDRLIIAGLAGLHEAGIYAAAMQLGMLVAVVADAVVKALSPWMYANLGKGDDQTRERIVRVSYLYFVGVGAIAALTALCAPFLLTIVGQAFRGGTEVLAFVALGSAFGGMYLMVVTYIFFARRNEWLSAVSLTVGTFNIGLTWWLVQQHGAAGAAQAFAASQCLMFLGTWFVASRCCPMPWRSVLLKLLPERR
jgi:O-antigen/teichoic acid export membrane protein